MAKLIQVSNNAVQSVAANGFLNIGTINRKVGCNDFSLTTPSTLSINSPGFYEVNIAADIVSTVATSQGILQVLVDGVPIETLNAYATVVGEITSISKSYILRIFCNNASNITIKNTSANALTINAVNISVIKVA